MFIEKESKDCEFLNTLLNIIYYQLTLFYFSSDKFCLFVLLFWEAYLALVSNFQLSMHFMMWVSGKGSSSQCRRPGRDLWVEKIPWKRAWQPTLVFLPGECNRLRSLVG